ncbi:MAG: aminomethyl-transferring glycine dehydrogenase subunit GcvPA [Candidatus Omnitrophica bacterium]|nr:aminomethyl-transferring glycine dehydrogenase subunit GcvPA [Candidatus Omnitrophota bacterium]
MDYVPITDADKEHMLRTIGVGAVEHLLHGIPGTIPRADPRLPPALTEPELLRLCEEVAAENATVQSHACFLGAGAYHHFVPSAVRYITSRGEFLTAYTPYQPEASQGTLQAMYEFQSILCDITGMDVANASLYDGASALAEACVLAARHTERSRILLAGTVHPEYRQTVRTYLKQAPVKVADLEIKEGVTDAAAAAAQIDGQTAAVVIQTPNCFGCLEPAEELAKAAHAQGALFIAVVNPVSLGVLRPPAAYGADIVVGEGQPLGTELQYGGPYLGLFACRQELVRRLPGRVVGMTRDAHGRRGFVLTLQTREQHIRRAKATSNICTNEAMMALGAAVHLSALGKQGFRELAEQNLRKAHYCREQLLRVPGVKPLFPAPFFNEFALSTPADPEQINRRLLEDGILGGFPLKRWDPRLESGWLVCVTEVPTRTEIDRFVAAVKKALR